ncbi:hypothetical protein GCM10023085_45670 [Actinomadura viridis]|uniref:Uncharacterized protein n=1 Tax=Actinomadura viridis TaxID=58110 RepID=A0A931GK50_9ACTN|nr:hypothetical protein [Actinomadura viridis]MBG6089927.1 hypothetical protein [Actinomadura viridis]
MRDETPDWAKQLQEALEGVTDAFARAGPILTAQGAMGWAYQGEFDKAHAEIAKLPRKQIEILSMSARALAEMADQEARR